MNPVSDTASLSESWCFGLGTTPILRHLLVRLGTVAVTVLGAQRCNRGAA